MESDDDYLSFSPEKEPSPPVHRRLKRLKKPAQVSDISSAEPVQEDPSPSALDPFKSTAMESSELLDSEAKRAMGFDDVEDELVSEMPNPIAEMEEQARSGSPPEGSQVGHESNPETEGLNSGGNAKEIKKSLNFDDSGDEFDGKMTSQAALVDENNGDLKREKSEKKRLSKDNSEEKRNKRAKSSAGEAKAKASARRREEKERKIQLQQLHAESQRLLRETRDAAFKPVPIVRKPISSVLEKIRQRKAQLLNRTVSLGTNSTSKDSETNHLSEEVSPKEAELSDSAEGTVKKTSECCLAGQNNPDASNAEESKEGTEQPSHESISSQTVTEEQLTNEFRAPVNDTQDLFSDTQASEEKDDTSSDHDNSHLEEVLAPSLLAMDLKFDSAPCDDISDEEDNDDKENTDPDRAAADHSSPRGDPVKAFVDDEAVEEDDSDNDLLRFQENDDDEGNEDFDDLKDLIATECEEKPSDKDRRNELHQKWLEQQDAAGTDNLLQRLKCGSKLKETSLLGDEEEDSDLDKYEEESDDEGGEDPAKTSLVRINSRKAKQMIPQMFSDKTDGYLSSDGEETEMRLVKQRILGKTVDKGPLLAPADDDRASEVFGLIKKLNVVPEAKKKTKTSFFEKTLLVANNSSFSKSSFLGRETSNSLPSSHKQGTSKVRSYIFGRDDSNSRSSLPISEDSLDVQLQNSQENRTAKAVVHKFSGSQSKTGTQNARSGAETVTGVSLFEMLKRSSEDTNACKQDKIVGLSQTLIASFRVPKKPINIQGRTR